MFRNVSNDQLARIDEILRQLDQVPADKELENRRRLPRINLRASLLALIISNNNNMSVKIFTRNINTSGAGFVCRRFCKIGEHLAICFAMPGRSPKLVLAKVTFSRYVRAGLYEAGVEFLECVKGSDHRDVPPSWRRLPEAAPPPAAADLARKAANAGKDEAQQIADEPSPDAAATRPAAMEKDASA